MEKMIIILATSTILISLYETRDDEETREKQ